MSVVEIEPGTLWQISAACRGADLEVFFPERYVGTFAEAREMCARCSVVTDCREMTDRAERGLPSGAIFGYFAGETPAERVERRSAPTWPQLPVRDQRSRERPRW